MTTLDRIQFASGSCQVWQELEEYLLRIGERRSANESLDDLVERLGNDDILQAAKARLEDVG